MNSVVRLTCKVLSVGNVVAAMNGNSGLLNTAAHPKLVLTVAQTIHGGLRGSDHFHQLPGAAAELFKLIMRGVLATVPGEGDVVRVALSGA